MNNSFIYRNIHIYRILMNLIYSFKYKQRFLDIINEIRASDKTIVELCFGDIHIAGECKKRGVTWIGIDINEKFVNFALKKGFHAIKDDLILMETLPLSDLCIISGSLYHFHDDIDSILNKMLVSSQRIIISEPVVNWSSKKGIIGKISRKHTNAGKGAESFRFDKQSMIDTLDSLKNKLNFAYRIISIKRDMIIEIKKK